MLLLHFGQAYHKFHIHLSSKSKWVYFNQRFFAKCDKHPFITSI